MYIYPNSNKPYPYNSLLTVKRKKNTLDTKDIFLFHDFVKTIISNINNNIKYNKKITSLFIIIVSTFKLLTDIGQ